VRAALVCYAASRSIARYPEPGLPDLTALLARVRGVEPQNVLIHGGSAALFDAILRAWRPRSLGIAVPAFAEYARAALANGIPVQTMRLDPRAADPFDTDAVCAFARQSRVDCIVATNPHNPLGFACTAQSMRELRALARSKIHR
jgi:threonine-phosphate decarboxylase